jgi:hypothetical protein
VNNPNEPTEGDVATLMSRLAAVGRDTIQTLRIQHDMVPVRLNNLKMFGQFSEPIAAHLIVRMALAGRND